MPDQGFHIILVDDNDIDLIVNKRLLELANIGMDITCFSSCREVLLFFENNREELTNRKNILLLDIQMPGKSGFECLDSFAEYPDDFKSSFSVFMLSSSIDRSDIKKAEGNKYVQKVLEKPLDVYKLKQTLSQR